MDKRWQAIVAQGEHSIAALMQAADSVLEEQTRKLAIQRRFQADMRDIWFMQPRFERATGKSIWRMLEQPRFRAAVDFLQLRAEAHEVDSVQAQWWMDLANADDGDRAAIIETYMQQSKNTTANPSRRRKPRSRRRPANAASPTPE